jgi:mannose-6-phosphate isomerase
MRRKLFSFKNTNHTQFHAYVCIEGQGNITYDDGYVSLAKGETVLVPASIGEYRIEGEVVLLKTYVPDLEKDVLARLMSLGYTMQAIMDNVGGLCKY